MVDEKRDAAGARLDRDANSPMGRKAHTVLVVDDEPASRYATARVLQDAGFSTLETGSGYDAIASAQAVAAIVLDVNLPDVNGVKVCSTIKSQPSTRNLPIVLHSAVYEDELYRGAGLTAGADAYLAPLQHEILVATLDKLLAMRAV